MQWPSGAPVFTAEQARQAPAQTPSQQTPSTQWPDVHCDPEVQDQPTGQRGTHTGRWQYAPGAQSASAAHDAPHRVPPGAQGKGKQLLPLERQWPTPSHWPVTCAPPRQAGVPHETPGSWWRHAPAPSQKPSSPQVLGACGGHWPAPGATP
jgi:hypothetical protein